MRAGVIPARIFYMWGNGCGIEKTVAAGSQTVYIYICNNVRLIPVYAHERNVLYDDSRY
jgi:hypothetical protein